MRDCLVCGGPGGSKEHFIPAWLSKETGRGKDPLVFGSVAGGQVIRQQSRGTSSNAVHKNLCADCNHRLGTNLEGVVKSILAPLVNPSPVSDWTVYLKSLTAPQRALVGWWSLLRALQLNEQFRQFQDPRIDDKTKSILVLGVRSVRDRQIPALPGGIFVEVARGSNPDWGFSLGKQLFDRSRGTTVHRDGSFLWLMQANQCLLVVASAPGARLVKDQGWGHGLVPRDESACPIYPNMKEMIEQSHIDTLTQFHNGTALMDLSRILGKIWGKNPSEYP